MEIYLKHPVHGTKIATMDLEAKFDEGHGWVRYNPDTPSAPAEVVPANELGVRRRRKITE
jgi:hypothetical protein